MKQVIRKTFYSAAAITALLCVFSGCASSSHKNYCDLVVENEAPESQDNTDKAAAKAQKSMNKTKAKTKN
jgi:CDGSH-type Zn-finger protein